MMMFRNLSIKWKLLWLIFLINLVSMCVYTLHFYDDQKEDILADIDDTLETAAYGVSYIVPSEFHDRIEDRNSISYEEHLRNVIMLTQYAFQADLKYLYTCMKFEDRVITTSTSESMEDIRKGTIDPFFTPYPTAPDSLAKSLIDGKIRYAQYTDAYGTFRSVFLPFRTAKGKVFVIGADIPVSFVEGRLRDTAVRSILYGLLIVLASFLGMYLVISRIMNPLTELTGYTKVLVDHDFNWGEYIRSKIRFICENKRDEVGRLAEALAQMESTLQNYIVNLTETTAAKERIESELSIARDIQMGILPQEFPAFPDRAEFDLHAIIEPAKEVGGDLYDYFMIDEHRLFFLIGDVSDKGVPAALFMAVTKTLFQAHALATSATINEVMSRVNQELLRENPWQMFVTAFAGIMDLRTGEVIYSDAGHEPPFILRVGEEAEILEKKGGPALCFFDDFSYEFDTIQLRPGDAIVLYTDGVTEAMNGERQLFSAERIKQALQTHREATPPTTITQQLFEQVKLFTEGVPQSDDIAILAIRYYGKNAGKASEEEVGQQD